MASTDNSPLPETIQNVAELEEVLTRPSAALTESIRKIKGPLLILGASGKMGPTLASLASRAAAAAQHPLEIFAASRFTDVARRHWLDQRGIRTFPVDLNSGFELGALPDASDILYLVGLKFGTGLQPAETWAINTIVPARVLERFPRARFVLVSTGNVYPLSSVARGGSVESDPLTPIGEYPNAAVGRERIFEYYSRRQETKVAILRLFYAVEARYGILADIGRKVHRGEAIDLTTGYFNCLWQGDANEWTLRSLELAESPPSVWNLCHPQLFSVREVATFFGKAFGRPPKFSGTESPTALLGNASRLAARMGTPPLPLEQLLPWIAAWIQAGGIDLGRPTHYEVRDGRY